MTRRSRREIENAIDRVEDRAALTLADELAEKPPGELYLIALQRQDTPDGSEAAQVGDAAFDLYSEKLREAVVDTPKDEP